ncbi:hypothetical protein V1478_010452 [Vespula squamosa]|uniref:Uncharacterized protein n=1 Tax=Vespula squamosa TaxID=30214 RepID=A0ABD2AIG8_VESSQ
MKADKTELTEKKVQKDHAIESMPITETSIPIFPSVRISEAEMVPSILASSWFRQVTVLRTPQSSWKMRKRTREIRYAGGNSHSCDNDAGCSCGGTIMEKIKASPSSYGGSNYREFTELGVVSKFFGLAQKSDRRATRRLRDDEDEDDDDVDEGGPTKDRQRVAKESG